MTQHLKSPPTIPSSIWALGSVSFLMKISSTIVFTLSPLFVTQVLGASIFAVGILEAILEVVTVSARIFSGVLSDFIHKRICIIVVAYFFALISRPFLAFASGMED